MVNSPVIFDMLNELCKLPELNDQKENEECGEKQEWVDPTHKRCIPKAFIS
jgi:hypothetical protein